MSRSIEVYISTIYKKDTGVPGWEKEPAPACAGTARAGAGFGQLSSICMVDIASLVMPLRLP